MHHTLHVTNLRFHYPDGHQALHGVTLSIAPGEKVALVGPNGAGKSTLMLHFNGILRGEGEVRVCGTPLNDSNLGQVRASVGLVFQDPDDQLFSPTVFDDVSFGPLHMGLPAAEVRQRQAMFPDIFGEGWAPNESDGQPRRLPATADKTADRPGAEDGDPVQPRPL